VGEGQSRRLAAILAADIAGYSALMGSDETRTVSDLKGHQAVVLPMVGDFGGRVIDTAGDGILAEFPSIVNAVGCAVTIQQKMVERNAAIEPSRRMEFRIGINLGDIIYDDDRIFGDGINVAARLEDIAEPGGICISSKVYEEINGRFNLICDDLGAQHLKNIARPVRVYRLRIPGAAMDETSGADTFGVNFLRGAFHRQMPTGGHVNAKSDQLAARRALPLRLFATYAMTSIILLLFAHYVILIKLDLDALSLRFLSLALPVAVGFALSQQTGHGVGAAFLLGATVGFVSVLGMLVTVGIVDAVSIVPSSRFEWQEAAEYAIAITLATMLGSILAQAVSSVRSTMRGP
jgi:class 3 adenylate cyclase